jgi:hypothetical protein
MRVRVLPMFPDYADLNQLGCSYEGYNPRYYSIDGPPGIGLEPVVG